MNTRFRALGVIGLATIVIAIVSTTVLREGSAQAGPGKTIIPTSPDQNPVLVYDLTGSTLAGTLHHRLSVYDTGLATISFIGFGIFESDEGCPNDGKASFTNVGTDAAKDLNEALIAAGAFNAKNGIDVSDSPLHTVTVFGKRSGLTVAHSFTFYIPGDQHEATLDVINEFIADHFPNF